LDRTRFVVMGVDAVHAPKGGSSMISLQTVALLSAGGLSQWIADDPETWHRINLTLARDARGLRDWRMDCRRHLKASSLLDEGPFSTIFSTSFGLQSRIVPARMDAPSLSGYLSYASNTYFSLNS